MFWVGNQQSVWVIKNCFGLLKGNLVFFKIRLCLVFIPFKPNIHNYIIIMDVVFVKKKD